MLFKSSIKLELIINEQLAFLLLHVLVERLAVFIRCSLILFTYISQMNIKTTIDIDKKPIFKQIKCNKPYFKKKYHKQGIYV